ncbi:MAG TPA: hypothetical protein VFM34_04370 [Moraxellaceae bacterium]|nr:hypothetical protein [Moraxellaceae bacterium]
MKRLTLPLLLVASPALADTDLWLDAYGGHVSHETGTLSLYQDNLLSADNAAHFDFDPNLRPMNGLRLRVDTTPIPFGFGIDFGYTHVHDPRADLRLLPVTLGVTLPSDLTLARGSYGSLHPIGMVGFVVTAVDGFVRAGPIVSSVNDNTWSGRGGRLGASASLGLEWRLNPAISLFSEYRYQQMRFHLEHTNDPVLPTTRLETTGDIRNDAILFGLTFRLLHQVSPTALRPATDGQAASPPST